MNTYTQNEKERVEISWAYNEERGLEKLNLYRAYRGQVK